MPGLYNINTRQDQESIDHIKYNADHQLHVDNAVPDKIDDYSVSNSQMLLTDDPFPNGTLSRATSLAGEIKQLRFKISELQDGNIGNWTDDAVSNISTIVKTLGTKIRRQVRIYSRR